MENIDNEEKLEETDVDNEEKLEETDVDNEEKLEETDVSNEEKAEETDVSNEEKAEETDVSNEEKTEETDVANEEKPKENQAKNGKNRLLIVFGAILAGLLVLNCTLATLVHWTDIVGIFTGKLMHEHSWNVAIVKTSSCTEDGLAIHVCEDCDEGKTTFLPAYGHTLVDNTCVNCGKKASEGLDFMLYTDEGDNTYAVITGIGTCVERELIIPSVIGGLPVREIAESAFKGNLNIYSVVIPEGVKKIGNGAFEGCENLYTILLPEGIEEMGLGTFTNTAYYNDEANWDENGSLYRQGYLLEAIYSIA